MCCRAQFHSASSFTMVLNSMIILDRGDSSSVTETPEDVDLSTNDPEFAEQMAALRAFNRDNHGVLKKLADT